VVSHASLAGPEDWGSIPGIFGGTPVRGGSLNGSAPRCEHLDAVVPVQPQSGGCQECQAVGGSWVSLLVCLTCGWVACSSDSPGAHALAHYAQTDHPLTGALEPSSKFRWCFVHRRAV
jgi:Zn-finger in ubiquitin-hydrolases and other protein